MISGLFLLTTVNSISDSFLLPAIKKCRILYIIRTKRRNGSAVL